MNDRKFLMWIHARLTDVYGESHLYDYMHRLRAIIDGIPESAHTPSKGACNSLEDLKRKEDEMKFRKKPVVIEARQYTRNGFEAEQVAE